MERPDAGSQRVSRSDFRDSQGNMGSPDVWAKGRHSAQPYSPHARRARHPGAAQSRCRPADFRSDAPDARTDLSPAVRAARRVHLFVHRAPGRGDDHQRRSVSLDSLGQDRLARRGALVAHPAPDDPPRLPLPSVIMQRLKESLPSLAVIAALIAAWWGAVAATHSLIFPTPWAVVSGTWELI